jgi:insulysin
MNSTKSRYIAHHNVAHIKDLTKENMMEFFGEYISPSSPKRSKLAIHILAQAAGRAVGVQSQLSLPTESKSKANTIENIWGLKSQQDISVSAGPQPVKDLSEFENLD